MIQINGVKIVTVNGRRTVNLPTFIMVNDNGTSADVLVPEDETTDNALDLKKIRQKYKNLSWDNPNAASVF